MIAIRVGTAMLCMALCSTISPAQGPADLFEQAPPAIEQAIRARVSTFYQFYVDGKFRAADKLVAEDSKDRFFEADKRRCHKFAIAKITYSDQFTKATVLVNCDADIMMMPKGITRVTMPLASKWKLEDGDWYWYVPPHNDRESPFGTMVAGKEGAAPGTPKRPTIADLRKKFSADRQKVSLSVDSDGTEEVELKNDMEGELRLVVEAPKSPDLEVSLDREVIPAKGTAKLKIRHLPNTGVFRNRLIAEVVKVTAVQLNQTLRVEVFFTN